MKFFESKYYVPLTPIEIPTGIVYNSAQLKREQLRRDMVKLHESGQSFGWSILETYCVRFPILTGYRLPTKFIEETWTRVTDLTSVKARFTSEITDGDFTNMYTRVYYHPESEFFAHITLDIETPEQNENMSTLRLYMPFQVNQEQGVEALLRDGSLITWDKPAIPTMSVLTMGSRGLTLKHARLKLVSIDFDTMYPEAFKEASDKIVEEVSDKENTGLIILHGAPGTGKTNYLRWLSAHAKRDIVFIPPEMVPNLTTPDFVTFLMMNKGLTLIVEDAESTLSPRMGSERSIVSTILNLTDGLLGDVLQCQFICTFNTELTNIDSALLRPGRLLVRQEFRNLTVEESNKYLKSVDSGERVDEPTSLAELTNIKTPPVVGEPKPNKTFGFNRN